MGKARPDVTTAQRHLNGRKQRCFIGIGLRGDDGDMEQEEQESQEISNRIHQKGSEFGDDGEQKEQESQDTSTCSYRAGNGSEEEIGEIEGKSIEQVRDIPVIAVTPVTEQSELQPNFPAPDGGDWGEL